MEFADLHHHTECSLLDGFGTVLQHVRRVKELGHSACAMTEHGTLRGVLALEHACKEEGVRPIFGCEFYVTRDHLAKGLTEEQAASVTSGLKGKEATAAKKKLEDALGIQERRHLVVLAENDEGLRNMIALSNHANRRGFYYKPRIDLDLLAEYSEGLVVNSGCIGSVIAQSALEGDFDRAIDDVLFFQDVFGDRFSLEIQPHPIDEQARWNKLAVRLSEKFGIPLVASNDSHYPAPDDWRTHDTLVAVGHRVEVNDCDRMRYEAETFGLKTADEMLEAFQRTHPYLDREIVRDAIERAGQQADRCRAQVWKPKKILLPVIADDPDDELKETALDGWDWRTIKDRAARLGIDESVYLKRLAHELKTVCKMGFSPYFIIVHDMIAWAREQNIMVGPGRGSAAGSLICYLLGITSLDPIEHGLLFERFLTPGREDWPDIDIDFEDRRRHEIFEYLTNKYGEENVAQITTFSRMKGKSALRDVARAHGVHYSEVDKVATTIVEVLTRDEEVGAIARALETDPDLQRFQIEYPDVIAQAMHLEGHMRHVGVHPAGVVTSPVPLTDIVPLERRLVSGEEVIVTAYDKYQIPEMGLVKLDILGLKTLSVLADAARLVEERSGEVIDYEGLPLDDDRVLQAFTEGDSVGVFQFDSPTARAATAGVVFENFEDITALNALNRPGPSKSGLADEWREKKSGGIGKDVHPIIAEICDDTLGVIIYQEHIIRILQDLAGYSPEEAGRLRKAISKSAGAGYLEAERPAFIKGAAENGMSADDASELWTQIEQFGAYGFNKSHAAAYALLAYWCQWMKIHYPAEFFCGLLIHETDPAEASRVSRQAARRGVATVPPDINDSRGSWTVNVHGELVAGLQMVKGIGDKAAAMIEECRPYADLTELIAKVNRRTVHRGVIVALAQAGALRDIVPNTKWFIENAEDVLAMTKRKAWVEQVLEALEASKSEPDFEGADAAAAALSVGIAGADPFKIIEGMKLDLLRAESDWTPVHETFDGSLVLGVMTSKKVGTSGKQRWAAIEIEGEEGARVRLRFDDEAYHRSRSVLDAGLGTLVAARVSVGKGGGARPVLLVDLIEMRRKWREGEDLTWQERAVCRAKEHPAGSGVGNWWKGKPALVLRVTERRDRNGRWMAFVAMDPGVGAQMTREVVCFADLWEEVEEVVVPGRVVKMRGKLDGKRGSVLADSITEG